MCLPNQLVYRKYNGKQRVCEVKSKSSLNSWISSLVTHGTTAVKEGEGSHYSFIQVKEKAGTPASTGPDNLSWEFKRKCTRLQIMFVPWSPSSVYRIFVGHWRSKQIWFILMQADGLAVETVKRFTERLHQLKDIMELKGSKRPYWSSSLWLTTLHFLVNERGNPTSTFKVTWEGGGKNIICPKKCKC